MVINHRIKQNPFPKKMHAFLKERKINRKAIHIVTEQDTSMTGKMYMI